MHATAKPTTDFIQNRNQRHRCEKKRAPQCRESRSSEIERTAYYITYTAVAVECGTSSPQPYETNPVTVHRVAKRSERGPLVYNYFRTPSAAAILWSFFRQFHRFFKWVHRASSGETIALLVSRVQYRELLPVRPSLLLVGTESFFW
jgi:hypothetical protein